MAILQTRTIYAATRIYEDTVIHTYTYIDNHMHINENKRARKKNKKKKLFVMYLSRPKQVSARPSIRIFHASLHQFHFFLSHLKTQSITGQVSADFRNVYLNSPNN